MDLDPGLFFDDFDGDFDGFPPTIFTSASAAIPASSASNAATTAAAASEAVGAGGAGLFLGSLCRPSFASTS